MFATAITITFNLLIVAQHIECNSFVIQHGNSRGIKLGACVFTK